ncbi:hypothetical protein NQ315_011247, partial [Exocentrus adspersus]
FSKFLLADMPFPRCLVCGSSVNDAGVDHVHRFPRNEQKSKIWQDAMGIKYIPGVSLKNYSICSRHFTVCSYLNRVTGKLCANAVPTLLPASSVGQQSPSEQTLETLSTPPRSIFRGIKGLSAADTTPRKQHLMNLVKSKEAHIRKLKKLCRKKTSDIKSLTNIGDSTVVRNVFRGMSSVTTDFLISQLRCAKKSPRGRRWTTQDKVLALALFKKSPKCYRLLRKMVALPSKNTQLAMLL